MFFLLYRNIYERDNPKDFLVVSEEGACQRKLIVDGRVGQFLEWNLDKMNVEWSISNVINTAMIRLRYNRLMTILIY